MIAPTDVTGLVLCGGAASRFGGRDKPLEHLHGVPLVEHVQSRLAPQVGRILISCNRSADAYRRYGEVVSDGAAGRGPLGGILAGLEHATTRYVFACPGDAPLLSRTLVRRLADVLDRDGADVAYPHDGERSQHLFLLIRRRAAGSLRDHLDSGRRAVRTFLQTQRTSVLHGPFERDCFANVNTEADLVRLNARACVPQPSHDRPVQ